MNEYSSKITRSVGRLRTSDAGYGTGYEGVVVTPHGYVQAETISPNPGKPKNWSYTHLRFVLNGREYIRNLQRPYTQLALTRAACRFANEIVARKK